MGGGKKDRAPPAPRVASHGARARTAAALSLLLFTTAAPALSLPYVPTTVLLPSTLCEHRTFEPVAYVFAQGASSVELLAVNYTVSVGPPSSSGAIKTLSTNLPFLDGATRSTAFVPVMADNGTVLVYVGDCHVPGSSTVWWYRDGTWTKHAVSGHDGAGAQPFGGPGFHGAAVGYTQVLAPHMSNPLVYTFGGMCPYGSYVSEADWMTEASYSGSLTRLTEEAQRSTSGYSLDKMGIQGPAHPSSGFSITPLVPSISNQSGTVVQQRQYVLLGGHTGSAFVNFTTAAVLNLPEELWTWIVIDENSTGTAVPIELAFREADGKSKRENGRPVEVEPRSGHSAVLSEDGSHVIVLGGWVGDVTQPALPQLAFLKMGLSNSDWRWLVPEEQPEGAAVFGHGAAMLPGNVMMVYGGYEIAAPADKSRAGSAAAPPSSPRFLNLTSMTWAATYANPDHDAAAVGTPNGNTSSSSPWADGEGSSTPNVGLAVGLGVGLGSLVLAIVGFLVWRARRNRRNQRDKPVRALAQDAGHFLHGESDGEMDERRSWSPPSSMQGWYAGGSDPYVLGAQSREPYRGAGGSTFAGSRSMRRAGGLVQPQGRYDRPSRGMYASSPTSLISPNAIHPIYEDDEDELEDEKPRGAVAAAAATAGGERRRSLAEPGTPNSETCSDPFATPTAPHGAPSFFAGTSPTGCAPSTAVRSTAAPSSSLEVVLHDPEVQDWMADVDAANALLLRLQAESSRNEGATPSPTFPAAAAEAEPAVGSSSFLGRSLSWKSISRGGGGAAYSAVPGSGSPTRKRGDSFGSSDHSYDAARPGAAAASSAASASGPPQLELPASLLGSWGHGEDDAADEPGSPSKSKIRPARGWLGSLRRVFSGSGGGTESSSSSASQQESPPRMSFENAAGSDYESRLLGLSGLAGGSLLRRKQGRHDWEAGDDSGEGMSGGGGGGGAGRAVGRVEDGPGNAGGRDDEWDIERAAEGRLVQVVFTVPREKLRVVNAEVEKEEESVVLVDPDQSLDLGSPDREVLSHVQREQHGREREKHEQEGEDHGQAREDYRQETENPRQGREHEHAEDGRDGRHPYAADADAGREMSRTPTPGTEGRARAHASLDSLLLTPQRYLAATAEIDRYPSPALTVSSTQTDGRESMIIMTAEAVRFEKTRARRTRVLEMVEGIESRNRGRRGGSPSPSPTRSAGPATGPVREAPGPE